MRTADMSHLPTAPCGEAPGLDRQAFARAIARGVAGNLDEPLSTGWRAVSVSESYLDRCWLDVPGLDQEGLDYHVESAVLIVIDLFYQHLQAQP